MKQHKHGIIGLLKENLTHKDCKVYEYSVGEAETVILIVCLHSIHKRYIVKDVHSVLKECGFKLRTSKDSNDFWSVIITGSLIIHVLTEEFVSDYEIFDVFGEKNLREWIF